MYFNICCIAVSVKWCIMLNMMSKTFLHNLERIMKDRGVRNKSELARLLSTSLGTVYNWFNREKMPDEPLMEKLIEKLNAEAYEFFLPVNSTVEVNDSMGELLIDAVNDLKKIEKHEDELMIAIVAKELVKEAKALERFEIVNNSESSKLLVQSQKVRLLEIAQRLTGDYRTKSPLQDKISKLSPVQAQVIESAIDGLLLSSVAKSQVS